jgi:hypothetical protein
MTQTKPFRRKRDERSRAATLADQNGLVAIERVRRDEVLHDRNDFIGRSTQDLPSRLFDGQAECGCQGRHGASGCLRVAARVQAGRAAI